MNFTISFLSKILFLLFHFLFFKLYFYRVSRPGRHVHPAADGQSLRQLLGAHHRPGRGDRHQLDLRHRPLLRGHEGDARQVPLPPALLAHAPQVRLSRPHSGKFLFFHSIFLFVKY